MPRQLMKRSGAIALLCLMASVVCIAQPGGLGPQGRSYYFQGGQQVRIYDGGTAARDAYTARKNLGINAANLTALRDTLSTLSYVALRNPKVFVTDTALVFKDDVDTTKKAKFELSPLTTGTTRYYSWPDRSGVVGVVGSDCSAPACLSSDQTWTGYNTFTNGGLAFGSSAANSFYMDGSNASGLAVPLTVPATAGANFVMQESGGKVIPATGLILPMTHVVDSRFIVKNATDTTKKWQMALANQTTGTTVTDSVPTTSTMLAGTRIAQTFSTTQTITPSTDVPGIKVNGNAGAVANLQEWYDSSPTLAAYVDATGRMFSGGGFAMYTGANAITLAPAALTASRTATFPDVTGTVCLISATQTLSGKTITNLKVATTVSGMPVVSGNGADPPAANLMGKVAKTAQTAAIAATNITDTCPAGLYEVSYYMETTTANVTDGTYTFQINYTDRVGATNQTAGTLSLAATTTGTTALKGSFTAYLASGNITYQTNLTGAHTTARYALTVRCVYKG